VVNEALQVSIYYHMMLFTPYTTDKAAWFGFGFSFIGALAAVMLFNVGAAAVASVKDSRRKTRVAAGKKAYQSRLRLAEEHQEAATQGQLVSVRERERFLRAKSLAGVFRERGEELKAVAEQALASKKASAKSTVTGVKLKDGKTALAAAERAIAAFATKEGAPKEGEDASRSAERKRL
jgi:hypothetical protein